jgi:hypothetical protein
MTIRDILWATLLVAIGSTVCYYGRLEYERDRRFWRNVDQIIVRRHDAWLGENGYERRRYMILDDGREITRWERATDPSLPTSQPQPQAASCPTSPEP